MVQMDLQLPVVHNQPENKPIQQLQSMETMVPSGWLLLYYPYGYYPRRCV